jgi:alpha-L-fucosidase 2
MPKRVLVLPPSGMWEEGYPLGNARLGGIFYGTEEGILSLDKSDLWDLTSAPETQESGFNYPHYVDLIRKGDASSFQEACRLFDACYGHLTPTKVKAGSLLLPFSLQGATSSLDLGNGVLKLVTEENEFTLFFSQTRDCFVFSFQQACPLLFKAPAVLFDPENGLGYPPMKQRNEGPFEIDEVDSKEGFFFALLLYRKGNEVYGDIVSKMEGEGALESRKKNLEKAAQDGFSLLLQEQEAWWDHFYQESMVQLPEEAYQREYDINEYLLASTSKRGYPPMPLQGVWCADNGALPPWKGDYHHDVNTEGCYASALKGNHLNAFSSWTDWLCRNKGNFEKNARDFYHLPGLVLPGVSDILGRPLGGWPSYALSPLMGVWALKSLFDYVDRTGDEDYLKEKAYPMLFEAGEAIRALLKKGKDGKLLLPLSSSPEIHDNTLSSFRKPISNCDLALLRWLFRSLSEKGMTLGKDVTDDQRILQDLPAYYQDQDGSLMLDGEENIVESHRHFSHLLMIYPLDEYSVNVPEEKRAMIASLRRLEALGTSEWVGFSFPYEAFLAERMDEGEIAKKRLEEFLDGFLSINGFHLNGDYRKKGYSNFDYHPFTLEGNFLFQSAIEEMLLQERDGAVLLFPVLPSSWKEASFRQLRSQNGLLVSASYKDGRVSAWKVYSPKDQEVRFLLPQKEKREAVSVFLKAGDNILR